MAAASAVPLEHAATAPTLPAFMPGQALGGNPLYHAADESCGPEASHGIDQARATVETSVLLPAGAWPGPVTRVVQPVSNMRCLTWRALS